MCSLWEELGPPVYVSAAAFMGLTKTQKPVAKEAGNLEELAAAINSMR